MSNDYYPTSTVQQPTASQHNGYNAYQYIQSIQTTNVNTATTSQESYNDPPMTSFPEQSGLYGASSLKTRRAFHQISQQPEQLQQQFMQSTYPYQSPSTETQNYQQQSTPQYQQPAITSAPLAPAPSVNQTSVPKLDPRQAPSPIQVREHDQQYYDQHRYQSLSGSPIPFSATDYAAIDEGCSTPKFIRSTIKEIPFSDDMMNQVSIPFGIICQPFASLRLDETPIPIVQSGQSGPIRCERCRAYMNPFVTFIDGGRKYICNLCKGENIVSKEYYCNLDANGRRCDLAMRPELCFGTIDMTAPKDYCTRNPVSIPILFVIDVSITAVQSGLTMTAVKAIRNYISSQENKNPPDRIAIITIDRSVHFYSFGKDSIDASPTMCIISDLDDLFTPIFPDTFFLPMNTPNTISKLQRLLEHISTMFTTTHVPLSCLGSALSFASKIMENTGGRIIVFQNNLPNFGPGSIAVRDESTIMSSPDRDKIMFAPQHDYYQVLGESLSGKGISVDLFLCPTIPFIDVSTIGLISSVTGGKIYCYFQFRPDRDESSIIRDIQWMLYKHFVYDTLIRIRVGDGLSIREYFGNFHMRNATDIEIAQMDSDDTISFSLKYEGKLKEKQSVSIQIAVLYTTRDGQRLIRLFNTNLLANSNPSTVFKSADIDTTISLITKSAISHCSLFSLASLRQQLLERTVKILAGYRRLCSSHSSSGQLILPDSLKLLPIYTLCLIKSRLFRDGRDTLLDKRIHLMRAIKGSPCSSTLVFIYPRLYSLLGVPYNDEDIYNTYRRFPLHSLSSSSLDPQGIFLLDIGTEVYMWIGSNVHPSALYDVFGVDSLDQIPIHYGSLPVIAESKVNKSIHNLLLSIELQRQKGMPLRILRQHHDSQEQEFLQYMFEDKSHSGTDYLDFLCHIHTLIQQYLANG